MKKSALAVALSMCVAVSAQADVIGLYIGGNVWQNQGSGSFGDTGVVSTLSSSGAEFDFEKENNASYFVAFEHPIPIIPNIKIASSTLDTTGMGMVTGEFDFGGIEFPVGTNVDSVFNTSFIDYTLYYEVFSNDLIAFDFGVTGRDISGDITVSEATAGTGELEYEGIIPMAYVAAKVGIPATSFNVFAEVNYVGWADDAITDYQVGIGYELLDNLAVDLDITVGYRSVTLELDDVDGLYSDLTFDGAYAGAVVHF
ncbi:TIGR04219 family outer membrane beta-barrel protein [Thalassotalea agarivorans]|uniref:Outer membrane protein n=1 Tax=Thalassotalea agarivorans TaxID=349064 RepID=A0A1I0H602_THASX|nr:TIGR04219 family outer membrane beta-barrel protein [Thalassotalea agarivorans]SET78981.1 outer membrane protein [Thalassotalea agarivorans]